MRSAAALRGTPAWLSQVSSRTLFSGKMEAGFPVLL